MVRSRPRIILSAAMSLDGKIATKTGDSELSSKIDKIRVHKLRSKFDAILVGSNTIKRDNPELSVRYARGKNPIRIILDSRGNISSKSKIVKTSKKIPTIIAVSKKATQKNILKLKKYSIEVIVVGQNRINIQNLLKKLATKKIKTILVEGGGNVNWQFIKEGLVDEIIVTITPYLLGGTKAISLVEGEGFSIVTQSPKLKLKKVIKLGNEVILNYA